ncbi:MAG: AMP-binding protein [Pseudomonadota bacterium]
MSRNARRWPERHALWADGRWLSYGDLDVRATRLAARLHAMGVQHGDRVGILALNHLAHFDLLLAAPKLGCIYTPFNHRLSVDETRMLFDYVRPSLLFVDAANARVGECFAGEQLALQDYENWLAAAPLAAPQAVTNADDAHMLLFTGGSTGTPKGALIPYRQTLANSRATVRGWRLRRRDCAIQATPCFHAALNVYATPLLAIGGRVVLMPAFEPGAYLKLMQEHGATRLFMVPTMYRMLAEHVDFATADFKSVRGAISGGAPCPPSLRDLFAARGIGFKQGFGMTEAGVNCFAISEAEAAAQPLAVGRPLPMLQAVIRHPDGSACAVDEVGELTLSGPQICAGYFEREREWTECFRDGWLWTGDLARVDASGLHFITGRRKEMFISGGENVYPAEVEAAVAAHPAVVECAVIGVPHESWGEVGLVAVALREGTQLDAEALSAWLKSQLAGYKRPREFLFMDGLPKTAAGKFNKPEIRRLHAERRPS